MQHFDKEMGSQNVNISSLSSDNTDQDGQVDLIDSGNLA